MLQRITFVTMFFCTWIHSLYATGAAADTLSVTHAEAEAIFLKNNLSLLAAEVEIPIAEARRIQAKAWPNPRFELDEINLWTNNTVEPSPPLLGRFGRNQQLAFRVEQLIQTAGKRKKSVNLESSKVKLASEIFNEVLVGLRIGFRKDLSELSYHQQLVQDFLRQEHIIRDLVRSQEKQYTAGNIAQAELLRIKALHFALKQEITELRRQIHQYQSSIRNDLALPSDTEFLLKPDYPDLTRSSQLQLSLKEDQAYRKNSAIRVAEAELDVRRKTLRLEESQKMPDLAFNLSYDRNGSTMLNFWGVGISLDIPLFNRNRGNILASRYAIKQQTIQVDQEKLRIGNEIRRLALDLEQAISLYQEVDPDYLHQLEAMESGITRNLMEKNLSLLEFLDFLESFRESKQHYYSSIKDIQQITEEIRYLTGE